MSLSMSVYEEDRRKRVVNDHRRETQLSEEEARDSNRYCGVPPKICVAKRQHDPEDRYSDHNLERERRVVDDRNRETGLYREGRRSPKRGSGVLPGYKACYARQYHMDTSEGDSFVDTKEQKERATDDQSGDIESTSWKGDGEADRTELSWASKDWSLDSYDNPYTYRVMASGVPMPNSLLDGQPGAFAIQTEQRRMQDRRFDAGTITAFEFPPSLQGASFAAAIQDENPPIAAAVADANDDISYHVRRILEQSAIPAIATLDVNEKDSAESHREATQSRRRRRLLLVTSCLILLSIIAVVIVMVLIMRKGPPPTTTMTIVIQLDHKPEETGWNLTSDDALVAEDEPGSYKDKYNELVTENPVVNVGGEYTFTIIDTGGDGIQGGWYKIYNAPNASDPTRLLVNGSGDFANESQHQFTPLDINDKGLECFQIDCLVAPWESWSVCSQPCNGTRRRTRKIITDASCGGRLCPSLSEEEYCNLKCCVDCELSEWSAWSPCTAPCGGGLTNRTRTILKQNNTCGQPCLPLNETIDCNTDPCNTTAPPTTPSPTTAPPTKSPSTPLPTSPICPDECCEYDDCVNNANGGRCSPVQDCMFHQCVRCYTNDHCQGSDVCDCGTGQCKATTQPPSTPPPTTPAPTTPPPTTPICQDECCDDSDCPIDGERCSSDQECMFHQCVRCFHDDHCGDNYVCDCGSGECKTTSSPPFTSPPSTQPSTTTPPTTPPPTTPFCPDECCDDKGCPIEGEICSMVPNCMYHQCVRCYTNEHCQGSDICDCDTGVCKEEPCTDECCKDEHCTVANERCSTIQGCLFHQCVQCFDDSHCDGNEECDCSIGQCKPPVCDDSKCPVGKKCSTREGCKFGECVSCNSNNECKATWYDVCECETGECICPYSCCSREACVGGRFCSDNPDCKFGECVECASDDNCELTCDCNTGTCDEHICPEGSNTCSSDLDCTGGKACSSSSSCLPGCCVECVSDSDCPSFPLDKYCDCNTGKCSCSRPECCDHKDCTGEDEFCSDNPNCKIGFCVLCDSDDDCYPNTCDCSTGTCEEPKCPVGSNACSVDSQCTGTKTTCSRSSSCLPGCCVECVSDSDCPSFPLDKYCDCNTGKCSCSRPECCDHKDCTGEDEFCSDNPNCKIGFCVLCDSDDDCYPNTCDCNTGTCEEPKCPVGSNACSVDSQCMGSKATCSRSSSCLPGCCVNCVRDYDCDKTEVCDCSIGECKQRPCGAYECCSDSDCGVNRYCSENEVCGYRVCVQCLEDQHCPSGQWCNRNPWTEECKCVDGDPPAMRHLWLRAGVP